MAGLFSSFAKAGIAGAGWEIGKNVGKKVWKALEPLKEPLSEYKQTVTDAFRKENMFELHEPANEPVGYFSRLRKELARKRAAGEDGLETAEEAGEET